MTDADVILWEKYTDDDNFSCEIYRNSSGQYDLFTFRYDKPMNGFCMMPMHRYLYETMEEAIQKADALLEELVQGQQAQ